MDRYRGYALSILICAVAVPIAMHFDIPPCFLLAAMASSLFGGRKPGILAVVLLSLADLLFLPPKFHLLIAASSIVRFSVFAGAMLLATELIDSKRRSDLARLQQEMDFRALAETCPDCIIIVDEEQVIRFANPAVSKMFGYSTEAVIGNPSSFLLPDIKADQAPAGDFSARKKSGERFDVDATCGRFHKKTTIFVRDVTDRKQAREMLEESEANLRLTLDTIPGLVYSRSPDGAIEYANRHATEFYGYTLEEIRNGAWVNALHPDEKESVVSLIAANLAKGEAYSMEYRRRRFDGVYRWFHTSVQPLHGPNGEVIRWYGLLTDIDDRRNIEESLRRTQGRLSQAMQLATASELAASIVHEISQPIFAIVANGQACLRWLSMSPPNETNARSSVERIVRDGKDVTTIIKGLKTLFKRSPSEKALVNLNHTVAEVFTLVHGRAERQGISIDLQVSEELPPIAADRIQLQQVLLNLVSNAIDSMQDVVHSPKKLIIRSQQQGSAILTEIVDHGTGITDYEKIFETFFTTKKNGMGMGLPICRSIIEAHDGRLWAAPGSPVGSIFSFTIPLPTTCG